MKMHTDCDVCAREAIFAQQEHKCKSHEQIRTETMGVRGINSSNQPKRRLFK